MGWGCTVATAKGGVIVPASLGCRPLTALTWLIVHAALAARCPPPPCCRRDRRPGGLAPLACCASCHRFREIGAARDGLAGHEVLAQFFDLGHRALEGVVAQQQVVRRLARCHRRAETAFDGLPGQLQAEAGGATGDEPSGRIGGFSVRGIPGIRGGWAYLACRVALFMRSPGRSDGCSDVAAANEFLVDELLDAHAAQLAAVARVLDAAERQFGGRHRGAVDEHHAGVEAPRD